MVFLFVLLAFSFAFVGMDVSQTPRTKALTLNLNPSPLCPSSSLLLGLVGAVAKRRPFLRTEQLGQLR